MRVAHILPNMNVGGRERMVAALCAAGPADGIEPVVIGYDIPKPDNARIETAAPYIQLDRSAADFPAQLKRVLSDQAVDVVHAQGHIPAHLLKHTAAFSGPQIATMHIGMQGSWRWLPQIRAGLRSVDGVYAVSQPMAKLYGRVCGRNVDVIHNGVDLHTHRETAKAPRSAGPFRFAMLSRLDPVKRHRDAIAAMDRLVDAGYNVTLTIAGEGAEYNDLARLACARDYIKLAGAVSDTGTFLASHHGFVICSAHEGMPMAVLEAMAAGLPIIATQVGGIPAMLPRAAMLVPAKNITALSSAMALFVNTHDEWAMRSAASMKQAQQFDASFMAEAYHAIYRRF
jgi:glycosyltransferase involved in cell wall biosynthesis